MLQADVVELLESGCALIVGLVTARGLPCASRGWGLTFGKGGERARLLLPTSDIQSLGHPDGGLAGTMIAATGCHILTLRSMQLKGMVVSVEEATAADDARFSGYCGAYFEAVAEVDSIPRYLMERMVPRAVAAVTFDVGELYDQTPGPNAGAAVVADA